MQSTEPWIPFIQRPANEVQDGLSFCASYQVPHPAEYTEIPFGQKHQLTRGSGDIGL